MHRRVGYACVAEPEQRSALNRCTCQKLASRVGSAPVARRGAPAAAAPSGRSASNVHNSPTQSTPGLSAQFLRTHHRRVRRGSSSYAAGFSGIRCASLASAATHAFVAAAAGQRDDGARCRSDRRFDGFDISCSVADAAAAPSFASARRREAALPAQTVTAALCNLRSVSQLGCAECTSRTPGGKPIGRCRRLLLLYASHTCANRVLMLRAARARCTG